MADTIFGKIARKEIPCDTVYEDAEILAFRDIHPQAPVHVLVIPKKPLDRIDATSPEDDALLGRLLGAARRVARELGLAKTGYRLVINNGPDGGESVAHLHIHILGGRPLGWPPG